MIPRIWLLHKDRAEDQNYHILEKLYRTDKEPNWAVARKLRKSPFDGYNQLKLMHMCHIEHLVEAPTARKVGELLAALSSFVTARTMSLALPGSSASLPNRHQTAHIGTHRR